MSQKLCSSSLTRMKDEEEKEKMDWLGEVSFQWVASPALQEPVWGPLNFSLGRRSHDRLPFPRENIAIGT